ncbi:outer membrane autotransporter barrel domain-containing protein [Pollutimonas bauzanensis]|uniref:Outer membrane autotransporter barrel domain-containing protein n=1 Tax=Pollutimonas bauzanensis TaxID=658167 RepID=A0A1M5ULE9_9BURK|nr:outer membrane autotransporter barrel domain-containing protein [Pollutimonas bauzanensis]
MITACALAIMGLAGTPVWANGGNGGNGSLNGSPVSGGSGGTPTAPTGGIVTNNGGDPGAEAYAGAGGGSVSRIDGTGGSGGKGSDGFLEDNAGGAGGTVGALVISSDPIVGGDGGAGKNFDQSKQVGASGGGGGGFGLVLTGTQQIISSLDITGGDGGNGGQGILDSFSSAGGGGGGEGGGGVLLTDTSSFINNATLQGGKGGDGGGTGGPPGFSPFIAPPSTANGGDGGDGGAGVELVKGGSITNNGFIWGGAGGNGGVSYDGSNGIQGNGGAGISGSGGAVFITNSGMIQGGSGNKGGAGVQLVGGGTVVNNVEASIEGGNSDSSNQSSSGIMASASTAVINFGEISAGQSGRGGAGVQLQNGGSVTNHAGASITGEPINPCFSLCLFSAPTESGNAGIIGSGSAVTVDNSGLILGSSGTKGGAGVQLEAGGTIINHADGAIAGGDSWDDYGAAGIIGSGSAVTVNNSGTIQGSSGVTGGAGVQLDAGGTIINNADGTITGGYSSDDYGAAGIIGSNIAIINSGSISGGSGYFQGAAIEFTGGVNSLEIRGNNGILHGTTGIVNANTGTNTLILGGDASNASFNTGYIGINNVYQGFSKYQKTGSGTWNLGGEPEDNIFTMIPTTSTPATAWTISEGTLAIRSDASLGAASGNNTDLTFDGGTLKILAPALGFVAMPATNITMERNIALASGSGTIDIPHSDDQLTLNGAIAGPGGLTKTGDGTLTLAGTNNTYQGGTTVGKGLVQVASAGAGSLGSGPVAVAGGTLAFGNTSSAAGLAIHNQAGGNTLFNDQATAGNAAITNDGALSFNADASLGDARIANNASAVIAGNSTAGQATFINAANGVIDIRSHNNGGVSIGSLSGAGSVLLGGNTLTLGGLNKDETFNGIIADGGPGAAGSLVKAGTGLMILNGVNTYTGLTTVDGGTLEIGDLDTPTASIVGNVQVNPAGTLRGHGTVGGSVVNNGTVRPGGSIGTLTIVGDYTQSEQGTLMFDISPTTASKLNVTGTATLAGTLSLLYGPGTYTAQTYHLLSAGNVVGNFTTVIDNAPEGLNLARQTGADFLNLEITGSGRLGPIIVRPTNATIFGAMGSVALREGQRVNDVLLNRLGRECDSPLSPSSSCIQTQRQTWMQVSGTDTRVDGNDNAPDYRDRRYGFLAGTDRGWGDWTVGVAGGYSHSDVTESGSNARGKIDTLRVAGYGARPLGPLNLAATVGYAYDFLSSNRPFGSLGSAKGDSHGQELHAGLQASAPLPAGPVVVTPRLGVRYQYFHGNSFDESGPTSQNLSVDTQNLRSLQPYAGITLDYPFNTSGTKPALVQARLGYAYETLGIGRNMAVTSADGTGFVIPGATDSRGMLTAGLGANMSIGKSLSLYVSYDALLKTGNVSAQTLQGGMNYRF